MKRRAFLLLPVLAPFFMVLACHGDKAIINQTQLPNIEMGQGGLPQGQDQNQITPPGGINSGGNQPPPGGPQGGPEVFVPGGPEPEITLVHPSPSEEEPPEEPSAPEPPATPYEVVSLERGREVATSSCFDFSVPTISGGNSIPTVVYEQNGSSRRKLVIAERSGGVWRPHTLLTVEGVSESPDCFFKPTLFMDEGQPYVTAKGSGNSLKMFTRPVGGAGWVDISPDAPASAGVGASNIDIRRVDGILKIVYKAANNHPRVSCYSFAGPVGCSREIGTIVPDIQAHLHILPWMCAEGVCDEVECEQVLRFAGPDDNVDDVLILKFCQTRNHPPALHLNLMNLPYLIRHPSLTMGPGTDRFTIVYANQPGNIIQYCRFESDNLMIGVCENTEEVGEHPSLAERTNGPVAITYASQNRLRLLKKNSANGQWNNSLIASQSTVNFGKKSIVQLAPVSGVLRTHILYTATDYAGRMTTLRYSVIP